MGPSLYNDLAEWFHLLTAPEDYAQEAAAYRGIIAGSANGDVKTVLELGSGGGNNASHLKRYFEMTLSDLCPAMLEVSEQLNPGCEHVQGDMRTLRLGRQFDAVFIHDALAYITSTQDVRRVVETAAAHCRPGGVALLVPDFVSESFRPMTTHGGHDGDGRSLRYLQWTWDPDPGDDAYLVEMAILLKTDGRPVEHVYETHVCGLFDRSVWLGALDGAGFEPRIESVDHEDLEGRDLFVGIRTRGE